MDEGGRPWTTETGEEAPILDDSPAMLGLQMSFEAGMARFLVLEKL